MKILIYADSQTEYVLDWIRLVLDSSTHSVLLVCSTTGRSLTSNQIKNNDAIVHDRQAVPRLLRAVKGVRRFFLKRTKATGFETLLDFYRVVTLGRYAKKLQRHIEEFQPDLIHAMRIPFEGVIASRCNSHQPLVLSVWGNDLTLHASMPGSKSELIRRAIIASSGVHADAERDIAEIKTRFAYGKKKAFLLSPASGGVNTKVLRLDISKAEAKELLGFDSTAVIITNPRGMRPYINTDMFIRVSNALRDVSPTKSIFILVGAGEYSHPWKLSNDASNIGEPLITTNLLDIDRFRLLLRATDILISPSRHDGVPISLIEGMGSGAFPIISKLESVAFLVKDQRQGRLFEVDDENDLLRQVKEVLESVDLLVASRLNEELISQELASASLSAKILSFYDEVYNNARPVA